MAPGTHTGAASPLIAVGGYPVAIDETLRRKTPTMPGVPAQLRRKRGRNPKLAETAVTDPKPSRKKEALDGSMIDLIAIPKTIYSASLMAGKSRALMARSSSSRWQIPCVYLLNSPRARNFSPASFSPTFSSSC